MMFPNIILFITILIILKLRNRKDISYSYPFSYYIYIYIFFHLLISSQRIKLSLILTSSRFFSNTNNAGQNSKDLNIIEL